MRGCFDELARRMPRLELAGEPEQLASAWANSLTRLPVTWR